MTGDRKYLGNLLRCHVVGRLTVKDNLRHWIIATATPWIASQYSPYGEYQSFHRTMLEDCLPCIFRACRRKAAGRRGVGSYELLIEHYRLNHYPRNGMRNLMYGFRYNGFHVPFTSSPFPHLLSPYG